MSSIRSIAIVVGILSGISVFSGCNPLVGDPSASVAFLQPPPGAFNIVSATPSDGSVALTWQSSNDSWAYNVLRGTASRDYPVTAASGVSGTGYVDSGLTDGTVYYYMIVAVGPGGSTDAAAEIQVTPRAPMLVIADTGNDRIVTLSDMAGDGWAPLTGSGGDSFSAPTGVFLGVDASILVADTANSRIVWTQDGQGDGWRPFGSPGAGSDQFSLPSAVAVDGSGIIYVADAGNGRIVEMSDLTGNGWATLARAGSDSFTDPVGLALTLGSGFFVADLSAQVIDSVEDMQGDGWASFTAGGALRSPAGVFVNDDGTIYVADRQTNSIYSLSSQGTVLASLSQGPASDAFSSPSSICVDASGTIYVADSGNNRIVSMSDMSGDGWTVFSGANGSLLSNPRGLACRYGLPGQG